MSLHELFNAVIDYRITAEGLGYAVVFVVVGLLGANAVGMTTSLNGGDRSKTTSHTAPMRKERTFPTAWQIRQIDPKIDRKLAFGHRLRRTHVNECRGARPPVFVLFCTGGSRRSVTFRNSSGVTSEYSQNQP